MFEAVSMPVCMLGLDPKILWQFNILLLVNLDDLFFVLMMQTPICVTNDIYYSDCSAQVVIKQQ